MVEELIKLWKPTKILKILAASTSLAKVRDFGNLGYSHERWKLGVWSICWNSNVIIDIKYERKCGEFA